MKRVYNFNGGPAALPLDVLKEIHNEWFDFRGTGESILEISHRSDTFAKVLEEAKKDIRTLLHLSEEYTVLFASGGANLQFAMIPMNFLLPGETASYVLSSYFSEKAFKEAEKIGNVEIAWKPDTGVYDHVPSPADIHIDSHAAYLHITTNGTAEGNEFFQIPKTGHVPLVADMTSDLMARDIDSSAFSFLYAGVQKNIGPAGTVLIVAKKSFLEGRNPGLPTVLNYETLMEHDSMINTPPVFAIYAVGKYVKWIREQGGLLEMERRNREKSDMIYDIIDSHSSFYLSFARKDSRSIVSVTFSLPSKTLTDIFLQEAEAYQLYGLKGHKIVGGIRVSLYNGVPLEAVQHLAAFMEDFYKKHGA